MNARVQGLRAVVREEMRLGKVPGEMEQSLAKEFVHLHILSALADAGVLDHVVFQGGTALRLCYGGERYSEDLDFVCGARGAYLPVDRFEELVHAGLTAARDTLARQFGMEPESIGLKSPDDPAAIMGDATFVAAWQLVVPMEATPRSPKSRIKVEFANVPCYDARPTVVRSVSRLAQVPSTILRAESPREILADKAVALTARATLKFRDVWDVHYLRTALGAGYDPDLVAAKFADYGTSEPVAKALVRVGELREARAADGFLVEMRRFLPAVEVDKIERFALHKVMLEDCVALLGETVLADRPAPPSP